MDNSNELREKLKNELSEYRGSIKEIAEKRGCSPEWVRQVLDGKWNDDDLLAIAANVLTARKANRDRVYQMVASAVTA